MNPLDFDTVAESVRKTGRAVVMHEGPRTLGFGAELAARIQEELFYDLEAPVLRATGFDTPYPPARSGEAVAAGPRPAVGLRRAGDGAAVSAVQEFLVPDLGEGLEDATITGWNVAVGDDVELNQTLCTVETNKAEVEIPSPYAGRVVELGGAEGDTLPVGSMLVRIATSVAEAEPAASHPMSPPLRLPPPSANGAVRNPVLVGYGADDQMDTSRRGSVGERPRAKPPVRKLAAELNVDLSAGDRFRSGRGDHARGCARRGGQVGADPGDGGGAWRPGRDGSSDDVVAQADTGCARRCSGRLLSPDPVA